MREILFRGKRVDNGEWFEGFYAKSGEKTYIIYDNDIAVAYVSMKEVISETIGQYTGLTDKNGKKIFEGDILKGAWETILTIFYDEFSSSYRVKTSAGHEREPSYYVIDKWEIIGNIHDNPELLKGGAK